RQYQRELGGQTRWADLYRLLNNISQPGHDLETQSGLVQITPSGFNGQAWLLGYNADGSTVRYSSSAQRSVLQLDEIESAIRKLDVPVKSAGLIDREDSYYYGHKRNVALPVYRALLDDAQQTRIYINPQTGQVRSVDGTRRLSRWFRTGLHDFDFALIRMRPIWDIVVILLLAGVTLVCATGTVMAFRRIRRDILGLRLHRRRAS
ncbi:MAG TPA: hypothetical protein VKZ92_05905, partial [Pseudohongiella sp.]|nr:hypothetical protein [Pseudohongiella sp.]